MLFIDPNFIFLFVPIAVLGYWTLREVLDQRASLVWLTLCSIFFYGYNSPKLVIYLVASYTFNFLVSQRLSLTSSRALFAFAVTVNLVYLGYFKYTNFFVANLASLAGVHLNIAKIALPLGISFFTFQQIVYLSDAYHGKLGNIGFVKYCTVNSFFPHLVAGPIIWHREIAPQLERARADRFDGNLASLGLLLFSVSFF